MGISLLFWILMLLLLFFGFYSSWPSATPNRNFSLGNTLILFILLGLLGWQVFGPALHK